MSVQVPVPVERASAECVAPEPGSTEPVAVADLPPLRPVEPQAADCCGEGCARCVFDIYEAALERHEVELAAWQAQQPGIKSGHP